MNLAPLDIFLYSILPPAVHLAGIIFAVLRWKRHPRVSLLITIACTLLVSIILFYSITRWWLEAPDVLRKIHSITFHLYSLSMILLTLAAIMGRKARATDISSRGTQPW